MEVLRNENRHRFEAVTDGQISVLDYEIENGVIMFTHTGVPKELEGRGIASALAKAGMEFARDQNMKVYPACSFIEVYMRRHPEYQDLLTRS